MTRVTRQRMPLTKDDNDAGGRAIDEAVEIRARLDEGMTRLQKRRGDREAFDAIVSRMIGPGGLIHLYNDALDLVQQTNPIDRLETLRDELDKRLEKGFRMPDDPEGKVQAQFDRLLARYETVCDAIRDRALTDVLDRVLFWEEK